MARHFNSANPDYITIGTGVRGTDLVGVMMSCWVNLDDTTTQHSPMSRWNNGNANSQWLLAVQAGGVPRFSIIDSGLTGHAQDGTALSTGAWHHIAGMYDGATMHCFVDGVDHTTTINVTLQTNVGVTSVYIGRQTDANYFTGAIAEATILLVNTGVTPVANYIGVVKAQAQGASLMEGMFNTEVLGYWPLLGGDSPEPDYGVGRDLAGPNPGTLTGTTTVTHPPTATILSFGRSRGQNSANAIA